MCQYFVAKIDRRSISETLLGFWCQPKFVIRINLIGSGEARHNNIRPNVGVIIAELSSTRVLIDLLRVQMCTYARIHVPLSLQVLPPMSNRHFRDTMVSRCRGRHVAFF